jgi:hypothetical protein
LVAGALSEGHYLQYIIQLLVVSFRKLYNGKTGQAAVWHLIARLYSPLPFSHQMSFGEGLALEVISLGHGPRSDMNSGFVAGD